MERVKIVVHILSRPGIDAKEWGQTEPESLYSM